MASTKLGWLVSLLTGTLAVWLLPHVKYYSRAFWLAGWLIAWMANWSAANLADDPADFKRVLRWRALLNFFVLYMLRQFLP